MTQYVWTGAVTDTSVWVRAREVTATTLELVVADNDAYAGATVYPTPTPAQNIYSWNLTGLAPNTRYYYRVDTNGFPSPNWQGTFRTHPGPIGERASYVFGAAGDAGLTGEGDNTRITDGVSDKPVFDTMRVQALAEEWAWFSHLGDLHYKNISADDVAAYRLAYFQTLNYGDIVNAFARQATLFRHVPITYVWDDHDFGANNSNASSPSNPAANTAYRDCVPHYGIPATTGIYQSWQVGRVLYIASDCRSFRSPNDDPAGPSKTMLGSAQKTSMENLLTADTGAEALVWMSSSRWIGPDPDFGDSWNSFADERAEMVQMLGDTGWLHRMIQLTADKHALSIASAVGNPHGNFPLFMFASMDSSYGDPDPKYDLGSLPGRQQYGTVRVSDYGRTLALTGTGWVNGVVWNSHTRWITVDNPVLFLDYTAGHISEPFEPVEDDQATRNDVTANRTDGGEARYVLDTGALSVHPPPDGVGIYDEALTLDVADDGQLPDQAAWRVHQGTVDEPRFPTVHVDLAANPDRAADVAAVQTGDRITITNPPEDLPPDPIEAIAEGGTERLGQYDWDITLNASPGRPWFVAQLPATVAEAGPNQPNRVDGASELVGAVDADDTLFYAHTPQDGVYDRTVWMPTAGPGAAFPDEAPFDVRLGGEVCRVATVESAVWDTFTRSEASSWGTTTSGHAWTLTNGSAAERSVDGTRGVVSWTSSPDTIRFQVAPLAFSDCEVLVRLSADAVATGESMVPGVLLRYTDTSNFYRARLHFGTTGGTFVSVTRASTAIGSTVTLPYTYAAGTAFWLRARIIGHRVLLRVWPVTASREPAVWHIDRTIDVAPLVATGAVGLTASAFAGNTNATRTIRYDDFEVITPQRMTVERAVNGVTKSHAAGALLSLAEPMIPPL